MKLSNYNYQLKINDENDLLYNTLSRKYIVFNKEDKEKLSQIFDKLNEVNKDNINIMKELIKNGMLIDDDFDELEFLKFNERRDIFQDEKFELTINPTLNCNFRCIYCFEEHKKEFMSDEVESAILKYVSNVATKVKYLKVVWFGGEPLLEFDRISSLSFKIKNICDEKHCEFSASMVTNGYLLDGIKANKLKELNIKHIQVTLDGDKEYHDKQRPLANGEGTFDKIMENLINILNKGILVTLRINISESNVNNIQEIFNMIPKEKRGMVNVSIKNIFQNENKISTYNIYRNAIEKGYYYRELESRGPICSQNMKNSLTIEPDGRVTSCEIAGTEGVYIGKLDGEGKVIIKNSILYKLKNTSAYDSEKCVSCIKLPICKGGCMYSRYKDKDYCVGLGADGLTLDEKIKLQYYNDLMAEGY